MDISSNIAAISPVVYTKLHPNTGITAREKATLILKANYPETGFLVMFFIHC